MKTVWKYRTNKGRVVYDHEKHPFTLRDLQRIMFALEIPPLNWETDQLLADIVTYLEGFIKTYDSSFEGWGEGKFGGAGTTRSFDEATEEEE